VNYAATIASLLATGVLAILGILGLTHPPTHHRTEAAFGIGVIVGLVVWIGFTIGAAQ
jgi:hypothetical protein